MFECQYIGTALFLGVAWYVIEQRQYSSSNQFPIERYLGFSRVVTMSATFQCTPICIKFGVFLQVYIQEIWQVLYF